MDKINTTPALSLSSSGSTMSTSAFSAGSQMINNAIQNQQRMDMINEREAEQSQQKQQQLINKANQIQLANNLENQIKQLETVTPDDDEQTIKEKSQKIQQLLGQATQVANQYGLTDYATNLLQNQDKIANSYKQQLYNKYANTLASKVINNVFDSPDNQTDAYQKEKQVFSYADNLSDPIIKANYLKAASDLLYSHKDKITEDKMKDIANEKYNITSNIQSNINTDVVNFAKKNSVLDSSGNIVSFPNWVSKYGKNLDNQTYSVLRNLYNTNLRTYSTNLRTSEIKAKENKNNQFANSLTKTEPVKITPDIIKENKEYFDSNGNINKQKVQNTLKTLISIKKNYNAVRQNVLNQRYIGDVNTYSDISGETYTVNIPDENTTKQIINILNNSDDPKLKEAANYLSSVKFNNNNNTINTFKTDDQNKAKIVLEAIDDIKKNKLPIKFIDSKIQRLKNLNTAKSVSINLPTGSLINSKVEITNPKQYDIYAGKIVKDNYSNIVKGITPATDFLSVIKDKLNPEIYQRVEDQVNKIQQIKEFTNKFHLKGTNIKYDPRTQMPYLDFNLNKEKLNVFVPQLVSVLGLNNEYNNLDDKQKKQLNIIIKKSFLKSSKRAIGIGSTRIRLTPDIINNVETNVLGFFGKDKNEQ